MRDVNLIEIDLRVAIGPLSKDTLHTLESLYEIVHATMQCYPLSQRHDVSALLMLAS